MSFLKKYNVVLINLAVFLTALILIETFFRINAKFQFIEPKNTIQYDYTHSLSPEKFKVKYKYDLFSIPAEYRYKLNPKIKSLNKSQLDHQRKFELSSRYAPNNKNHVELRFLPPNQDVYIYSADYVYENNGNRRVEYQDHKTNADKFIITMGDSFTFGEGVTNGNELASQLAKKIGTDWKVYNYGAPGSSTNDFLYKLEFDSNYLSEIKEKNGVLIWYFIDEQIERFFCNLNCYENIYNYFVKNKPYYKYENNRFSYKGVFADSWEPKRLILQLMGLSETIKFSGISIYKEHSPEQIDIFTKSFQKLLDNIKKKLGVNKFYIVSVQSMRSKKNIFDRLAQQTDIEVLDLTDIPQFTEGLNLTHPLDGHPTAELYWIVSEILKNKIDFK